MAGFHEIRKLGDLVGNAPPAARDRRRVESRVVARSAVAHVAYNTAGGDTRFDSGLAQGSDTGRPHAQATDEHRNTDQCADTGRQEEKPAHEHERADNQFTHNPLFEKGDQTPQVVSALQMPSIQRVE